MLTMTERQKAKVTGVALLVPVVYVLWVESAYCVLAGSCDTFGMLSFIVFWVGSMLYLSLDKGSYTMPV